LNIFRVFDDPLDALRRYLGGGGAYPWRPRLRTPTGWVQPTLCSPHDVLTAVEIFCRHDYGSRVVGTFVDIGANIGLASLFFLSRTPGSVAYCFEPDPRNVRKLRANLAGFADRVNVRDVAVTIETGRVEFLQEASGRYSGLVGYARWPVNMITVEAVSIVTALGRDR